MYTHTEKNNQQREKRAAKILSQRLLFYLCFSNFKAVLESKAVGGSQPGCQHGPRPLLRTSQCTSSPVPRRPAEPLTWGSKRQDAACDAEELLPKAILPAKLRGSATKRTVKMPSPQGSGPPSTSIHHGNMERAFIFPVPTTSLSTGHSPQAFHHVVFT